MGTVRGKNPDDRYDRIAGVVQAEFDRATSWNAQQRSEAPERIAQQLRRLGADQDTIDKAVAAVEKVTAKVSQTPTNEEIKKAHEVAAKVSHRITNRLHKANEERIKGETPHTREELREAAETIRGRDRVSMRKSHSVVAYEPPTEERRKARELMNPQTPLARRRELRKELTNGITTE